MASTHGGGAGTSAVPPLTAAKASLLPADACAALLSGAKLRTVLPGLGETDISPTMAALMDAATLRLLAQHLNAGAPYDVVWPDGRAGERRAGARDDAALPAATVAAAKAEARMREEAAPAAPAFVPLFTDMPVAAAPAAPAAGAEAAPGAGTTPSPSPHSFRLRVGAAGSHAGSHVLVAGAFDGA